jgi:hypothetical protein
MMSDIGDVMTNEEYQRQANERSRQNDEARRRQGIEDFNRRQREQQARNAQASKEAYSRRLGSMGAPPPIFGPPVDRTTYNRALQGYQAHQRSMDNFNRAMSPPVHIGGGGGGVARKGGSSGLGKVVVLIFVVGGIWLYFSNRSQTQPSSTGNSSVDSPVTQSTPAVESTPIPKPSPVPREQAPEVAPTPAPWPDSTNISATTANEASVPAASEGIASWPAEGMSFAANHKGIRNGCKHGSLTLAVSQVAFSCPTDESKSFMVQRAEVKSVDGDGIELFSKKKLHFDIAGKTDEETHALFVRWLGITAASLQTTPN